MCPPLGSASSFLPSLGSRHVRFNKSVRGARRPDLFQMVHIGQAIYYKRYWLFPTVVLAGIAEVVGWGGRYWSSQSPGKLDPYLMQYVSYSRAVSGFTGTVNRIVTTIIAPTPLVAVNFIILGRLIRSLGTEYSRLGPKKCVSIS